MNILLAPAICQKIPGIHIGVLCGKNLKNQRKSSMLSQLLRGVYAEKKKELKNKENKKILDDLLALTLKKDYLLSETLLLQSLLDKILQEKDIQSDNNLLDYVHYLSIKNFLPVFGHDLDQVEQDVVINFSKTEEVTDMNFTKESKNIVAWFFNPGNFDHETFQKLMENFLKSMPKYCGGIWEMEILDQEKHTMDLHYVSDREKLFQEQLDEERKKAEEQHKIAEEKKAEELRKIAEAKKQEEERQAEAKKLNEEKISSEVEVEHRSPEHVSKSTEQTDSDFSTSSSIKSVLEKMLADAVQKTLPEINTAQNINVNVGEFAKLENQKEKKFGDYSSNIGLKLSKLFQKNPREVAEMIIKNIPHNDLLQKTEIAGAGFINFYLFEQYFAGELEKILDQKSDFGRINLGKNEKVLVEFSSPNIAKPLGAHHLPTTLIGQALANILQFAGYNITTLNWLGDWGTQFGKLLHAYKNWGNEEAVKANPLKELLRLYVMFHDKAEVDPALEDKGREEFKKLEEGDMENNQLWSWFRELSIVELEKLYEKLHVHFDEYLGERMYLESAKKLVEEGKQKNVVVEGEKGALIVKFENDKYPPYLLQKADGTSLYATRDLASIQDRIERFQPQKILYVVDVAQKLHLAQLFETARLYGFTQAELVHVVFGRMQFADQKMSTRKGTVVLLDELIDEAFIRAKKIVDEKSPNVSEDEKKVIIEGVALGALKYHVLSQNRETNLIFDWDRMLSLDGNSAPYLQYTYARAQSIVRKSLESSQNQKEKNETEKPAQMGQMDLFEMEKMQMEQNSSVSKVEPDKNAVPVLSDSETKTFSKDALQSEKEEELLRLLPKFPEIIEQAAILYKPNVISNYLFELAQVFNAFYQEAPVLQAPAEVKEKRLKLVRAAAQILQNGLRLLGIDVFEKM